jgi:Cu(I)/Ag(I) efflux system membrane fusion protein
MSDERNDPAPADPTPPRDDGMPATPVPARGRGRFILDVVLVRVRFLALFVIVGLVAGQWDRITARWERWMRPAAEHAAEAAKVEYFCPMHPQVVRDAPGSCPICGMPLSRREKGESGGLPAGVLARVQLSPLRIAQGGVRTVEVSARPLVREVPTAGFVEVDERREKRIAARVAGRVDGLSVDFTGMRVAEGDPLVSLYSPDLITAEEALLSSARALEAIGRGGAGPEEVERAQRLLDASRDRLLLWGLTPEQVEAVRTSGKTGDHVDLRSPLAGTVLEKKVSVGKYVMEGEDLFRIADLTRVWVRARVFAADLALARVGAPVEAVADAFPGETFKGTVAFTDPVLDPATRTAGVRMDIVNPGGRLLPGMFVTARLRVPVADLEPFASRKTEAVKTADGDRWTCPMHPEVVAKEPGKCPICSMALVKKESGPGETLPGSVLAVPEPSVIDTGTRRVVYRESSPGVFDAVEVVLGPRAEGWYPVISGVAAGDRVVAAGAFLVDAETRLNPSIAAAYFGASSAPAPAGHGRGK